MKSLLCGVFGTLLSTCAAPAVAEDRPTVKYEANTVPELVEIVSQAMLDKNTLNEYGAFLSCDTNKCWSSDFAYGDDRSISGEENKRIWPKYSPDLVVGYIHVHPYTEDWHVNNEFLVNELNKMPSSTDYFSMVTFAEQGKVYQPFALWIVGPDDVTREYPLPRP